ncbi:MAG: M4 family metallopeptidase, partial [Anaerolineae bacterium]|nr:M4 family metallopeptidase [Anaerolineae bacterium]
MGNHSSYPNHHLRGILPPYILEAIVKNAPDRIAEVASETLRRDTFFRNSRVNQAVLAGEASPQGERKSASTVDAVTPERLIYDVDHKGRQHLPGKIIRREGQVVCGDDAADEAYEGLGHTFEFYRRIFQRNSIDDEGMALLATVHYNERHNNAFWDGRQMVFGDGDGYYFQRFTLSLDIIGHELAHGVVQHTAGLQYSLQAGALNESICDVMGSLLKQWLSKETVERADWLIGAGLFTNRVQGVALRSMQQPGTAFDDPILEKDPQVGHMNDFVRTEEDNGGVHINSGIPNRAFYLAATAIGGYAWEKAGQIWYTTLCDKRLKNSYGFMRFARLTVDNAGRLFSQ